MLDTLTALLAKIKPYIMKVVETIYRLIGFKAELEDPAGSPYEPIAE